MDFQGRVIQYIGETTGTSKAGNPWKKKEWVVETFGQFARKVIIQCFGDKSDNMNLENGKDYTFYVDLESREFNGRWYTDVSVYRVEEYFGQQGQFNGPQGGYGQPTQPMQPGGFGNAPYGQPQPGGFPGGGSFNQPAPQDSDEDLPF